LKDLGVDRSIILEWLVKIGWEDAKWTDLAYYWDNWRSVVNTVMNLGVLQNAENLLTLVYGICQFVSWSVSQFVKR
jgi:hypothetical protein